MEQRVIHGRVHPPPAVSPRNPRAHQSNKTQTWRLLTAVQTSAGRKQSFQELNPTSSHGVDVYSRSSPSGRVGSCDWPTCQRVFLECFEQLVCIAAFEVA